MSRPSLHKSGDKKLDAMMDGIFEGALLWMAVAFKKTGQITPSDVAAQMERADLFFGFFPHKGKVKWRVIKGGKDLSKHSRSGIGISVLCSGIYLDTAQEADDLRLVLGDGKPQSGGPHGSH